MAAGGSRQWAYAGVALGLGVSVWANIAHAQAGAGGPGRVVMAGFWPLALFLALEVLTRTSWQGGHGVRVARVGVGVVAAVAAIVSYLHLHALLVSYGEQLIPALVGPLAIDGLMAVSAASLLAEAPRRRHPAASRPAPARQQASPADVTPDVAAPVARPHLVPDVTPDVTGDVIVAWVREQRAAGRQRGDVLAEGMGRFQVSRTTMERRWRAAA